ncbi:extracellular substrate binding-like orphan protein GrrP [Synechococcus sp. CS-1328]|uniref:extracellular substrate binding-like orphan protein GrrP n=1 Tax=Synechococcus sp. CS-1328 TaxID=2847976 RepID=UPI00223BDD68|nr:extracellular substrate binding-like orphan protein GrrP [Synechococcus sp. CS-1328]
MPPASQSRPATSELRAVVFDAVLPFIDKRGDSYEGLAVDVLNAVRDEAAATSLRFMPAASIDQGLDAITTGKADIACGVAFTWPRTRQVLFTLPFAIGGTRLLAPAGVDGTPDSLGGRTVGVVENSAAAQVIASVVPAARLRGFKTPAEALAALNDNSVEILAGSSLWLAANRGSGNKVLVPTYPYGRSGIGCIVAQNNPRLLTAANLAIAQMMQAYVDGDSGSREMVNRWVGPGSAIKLSEEQISDFYQLILTSTAEISTTVKPPDKQGAE